MVGVAIYAAVIVLMCGAACERILHTDIRGMVPIAIPIYNLTKKQEKCILVQ